MDPMSLIPLLQAGVASRVYSLSQPIGGYMPASMTVADDMSLDPSVGFDPGGNMVSVDPNMGVTVPSPNIIFDAGGNPMSTQPGLASVGGGIVSPPSSGATDAAQNPSLWQQFLSGLSGFTKGIQPGIAAIGSVAAQQQRQAFEQQLEYEREKAELARAFISRQAPGFHSEGGTTQPLRLAGDAPGVTVDPLASYAELLRGLR